MYKRIKTIFEANRNQKITYKSFYFFFAEDIIRTCA